ncbi:MAG TPA: ABC transporter substrate-binding protein, partial [Candidatus Cloacimonas sp.]|nr:ABC transporter substrate-binding protein [Candidatus Cloacimonas sp.]
MNNKRETLALLLLLLSIFLLTGCKKSDKQNGAITQSNMEQSPYSTGLFTIRYLPVWTHQAEFAGVYMAQKKGFYNDKGLNVLIQTGGPHYPPYDNLQDGHSDIVQMSLLTAIKRDSEKDNLVNLAQLMQRTYLMLVGKKSRGINSIADFNGKRIGLWKTDDRLLSLIFLQQHKLNMDIVDLDTSINLFLKDGIDIMNVMRYNEYHQLQQAGIDIEDLFTVSFADIGLNVADNGLYTTREFYEKHSKHCRDFVDATIEGWLYAINNQEETISTVLEIMHKHHLPANRP